MKKFSGKSEIIVSISAFLISIATFCVLFYQTQLGAFSHLALSVRSIKGKRQLNINGIDILFKILYVYLYN